MVREGSIEVVGDGEATSIEAERPSTGGRSSRHEAGDGHTVALDLDLLT
jgi:hypothetical protein